MMFFGKSKGKDVRKKFLKQLKDEDVFTAKMKTFGQEFLDAVADIKPGVEEIFESPQMKKEMGKRKAQIKKIESDMKEKVVEGEKKVKEVVKKGKKVAAKKLREVSGLQK